jgi:hypothetical protein
VSDNTTTTPGPTINHTEIAIEQAQTLLEAHPHEVNSHAWTNNANHVGDMSVLLIRAYDRSAR